MLVSCYSYLVRSFHWRSAKKMLLGKGLELLHLIEMKGWGIISQKPWFSKHQSRRISDSWWFVGNQSSIWRELYESVLTLCFPLFIHLPSSGKPRITHPKNKPVTLGFFQNQSYVNDRMSWTRQQSSFGKISLLLQSLKKLVVSWFFKYKFTFDLQHNSM